MARPGLRRFAASHCRVRRRQAGATFERGRVVDARRDRTGADAARRRARTDDGVARTADRTRHRPVDAADAAAGGRAAAPGRAQSPQKQ